MKNALEFNILGVITGKACGPLAIAAAVVIVLAALALR